jgi:hypothetical protein
MNFREGNATHHGGRGGDFRGDKSREGAARGGGEHGDGLRGFN